jgi:predicted O-methyltransferase YrrM
VKFSDVTEAIAGIPYVMPEMAKDLYDFVMKHRPKRCLELGFGHGASSSYIAAALDEIGTGRLTSVDLLSAREWQKPPIEEVLAKTDLQHLVDIHRERSGYNWFLKKEIAANSSGNVCRAVYDFCFIDGAKNWTIDAAAFFLVDKLLKPGGWIVFDDLQWTYRSKLAEGKRKSDGVYMAEMGDDELDQPHVELIFQLLVMQHPDYANFYVKDNWWAWAQKTGGDKSVRFEYSEDYLWRKAEKERRTGVVARPPFVSMES